MTMSALDRIVLLAREELAQRGVSPDDAPKVAEIVGQVVTSYETLAAGGQATPISNRDQMIALVIQRITGLGPLEQLLVPNGGIEDIFIEDGLVKYFIAGKLHTLPDRLSDSEAVRIMRQLLEETDVSLDRAHPTVDGVQVLGGRARLAAAMRPATPRPFCAIRLYTNRFATLRSLEASDTLTPAAGALLTLGVWSKGSVLIAGETGSGKTTLMAALLAQVRGNHRALLCEESLELQFRPEFGVRINCVPGGRGDMEPSGADTLRDLVKLSLRLKPDVLGVGEVRGEEAWELARASRVGAGFMATIHANSAEDALEALVLTALGAGENIQERLVRRTFSRSIQFVVFCERADPNVSDVDAAYLHQVTEIRALMPSTEDAFSSEPVFVRPGGIGTPMEYTGRAMPTEVVRRLERQLPIGVNLDDVLKGREDPRP